MMSASGNMSFRSHDETPQMTDADFASFGKLIHELTGIVLTENKRCMLNSRLLREVRRLGLSDFASYRRLIEKPGAAKELEALTSAVTTNVTSFFRGPDQFVALTELLPELRERVTKGNRVRIWSAGCSTGQEPYSIAMTILDQWPEAVRADVRILATDIDANVVAEARQGHFDVQGVDVSGSDVLRKFVSPGPRTGQITIAPNVRSIVRFEQLNLLGHWPFRGQFDIIFCRNVVIYFDAETRHKLWRRFAERLDPGSWLFVGHSERVDQSLQRWLRSAGVTRYRRTETPMSDIGVDPGTIHAERPQSGPLT